MQINPDAKTETAIFAGGCFWCMEPVFDKVPGVLSVIPGYIGGNTREPSYQEVCSGDTGHLEAVQIRFDPDQVSYRELLELFWRNIDPSTRNRQFCDFGTQYQTAIFYTNEPQRKEAEASKKELEQSRPWPIATQLRSATIFYPAEEYHHQYYRKNPLNYQRYQEGCGRRGRLKELWGE